ncbi:WXG100 family type VII secretion target [Bacillus clarus]|uniref:Secretion target family protein n=1 Tax=Bacillus clarus TaxID=2338372 RepID=A0A090YLF6_9BACI|nr:secretion target family protein [Bacillus clarus]RFT67704.1 WXG100 family type VII secretion target [Bacillus clarus]
MVQIKVTPEMLEEVENHANNTRNTLESIHNNLCNQIDHLCYQWIGASNQHFVQMFNDAKPMIPFDEHLKVPLDKVFN